MIDWGNLYTRPNSFPRCGFAPVVWLAWLCAVKRQESTRSEKQPRRVARVASGLTRRSGRAKARVTRVRAVRGGVSLAGGALFSGLSPHTRGRGRARCENRILPNPTRKRPVFSMSSR